MPLHGYTRMFENMLDHPNITIMLNTDFAEMRDEVRLSTELIYTGPVDEYFDYRYGKLPYRSLRFQHETLDQAQFQPVASVNYPGRSVPYTRVTEYKHLTGQEHAKTSVDLRVSASRGRPLLSGAAAGERRAVQAVQGPGRRRRQTSISSGGWPPTATTTWTRWWGRRWRSTPSWRRSIVTFTLPLLQRWPGR